jgi:hypothetical protein
MPSLRLFSNPHHSQKEPIKLLPRMIKACSDVIAVAGKKM